MRAPKLAQSVIAPLHPQTQHGRIGSDCSGDVVDVPKQGVELWSLWYTRKLPRGQKVPSTRRFCARSGYRDVEWAVEADVGDSFDVGQKAEKMLVDKFNHSDDDQQCCSPKIKRDDSAFVLASAPRPLFSAFSDSRYGPWRLFW